MPSRVLSRDEFNALQSQVAGAAPEGLSKDEFQRYFGPAMQQALGEAENTPAPVEGGAAGRFISGAWDHGNNVPLVGLAKGIGQAIISPIETVKGIYNASADQGAKAVDAFHQGHYVEAAGHAGGMIPLIGPAAAKAGEAIAGGDVAGGLGQGVGQLASIVGGEKIGKAVIPEIGEVPSQIADNVGEKLSKGAERVVNSNLKPSKALVKDNVNVDLPRVILNEKFSPGMKGYNQASGRVNGLSNELSQAIASAQQNGPVQAVSIQPGIDNLKSLEQLAQRNVTDPSGMLAARQAQQNVINNPLSGADVLGPDGEVIGRKLVDQTLPQVDAMKKAISGGLKGKYGKDGSIDPSVDADKAFVRGLKDVLNQNVPPANGLRGAAEINAEQGPIIGARNALYDMGVRNEKKLPIGPMDLMGLIGGGLAYGAASPATGIATALALGLKHPTTAFPMARGIDNLGAGLRNVAPYGTVPPVPTFLGNRLADSQEETPLQKAIRISRQP